MSTTDRIVVIGAGMVGHRFVEELLRADHEQRFTITWLGAEQHAPYNRILLSDVLAGRATVPGIELPQVGERVDVRRGVAAVSIDRDARRVQCADGTFVNYDQLVLATGADAVVPPFSGLEADPRHVHVLRTLTDCTDVIERSTTAKSALVVGGGVLGLEAACGLRRRGMQVTVVDLDQHLMARQLDAAPAEVLAGQLTDLGIDVRPGVSVAEVISAYGELVAVRLDDESVLSTDLMLISCGIRPATSLAADAGLLVERGIVVDEHLATDDPRIFAVGDCAQPPAGMTGLLAPGWRQAEALVDGLVRGVSADVALPEREGLRLKAVGADLVTAGVRDRGRRLVVHDPDGRRHIELVVEDDRLIGYTCVGSADTAASLAVAHERATAVPSDPLAMLVAGTARTAEASPMRMPGGTTVCRCNNVSKADIVKAWENGASDVDGVVATTRATTGCGGCTKVVCGLVDWLNEIDPGESGSRNTPVTQGNNLVTTTS